MRQCLYGQNAVLPALFGFFESQDIHSKLIARGDGPRPNLFVSLPDAAQPLVHADVVVADAAGAAIVAQVQRGRFEGQEAAADLVLRLPDPIAAGGAEQEAAVLVGLLAVDLADHDVRRLAAGVAAEAGGGRGREREPGGSLEARELRLVGGQHDVEARQEAEVAEHLSEADAEALHAGRQELVGAGVEFALSGLDAGGELDHVLFVFKRCVLDQAADGCVGLPLVDAEAVAEGLRDVVVFVGVAGVEDDSISGVPDDHFGGVDRLVVRIGEVAGVGGGLVEVFGEAEEPVDGQRQDDGRH